MRRADVTLSLPLPDEATQEDAESLGSLIKRIVDDSPAAMLGLTVEVARVEMVDGNRLGRTGAANLLDQMRGTS